MDTIISIPEILVHISSFTSDVKDWMCFMRSCQSILKLIYPKFISQRFIFMTSYGIKLPPCIIFRDNENRLMEIGDSLVVTEENLVMMHSIFHNCFLYESYGLLLQGLKFDCHMTPQIDYNNISNILIKYCDLFDTYTIKEIISNSNIEEVDIWKSLDLSTRFVEKYRKHALEQNMDRLYGGFKRNIRSPQSNLSNINYIIPDNHIRTCVLCLRQYDEILCNFHQLRSTNIWYQYDHIEISI